MLTRVGRVARRVLGNILAAAVLLGIGEAVLRLVGFHYEAQLPLVMWNPALDHEIYTGESMHRFHPYWFWELRPGSPVKGCADERINRAGFRGPEREATERGRLRIVTLGDSGTFGMGVCWRETYSAVLERELPGSTVLNFGVHGFTAFQGEQLLAGRALAQEPTLVLAAFGTVNEQFPASDYNVHEKFAITSRAPPWSFVWRDRLRNFRLLQAAERIVRSPSGPSKEDALRAWREYANYAKFQQGARDYVRWQDVPSFERSLEAIAGLARSHGAQVAFIDPPRSTSTETRWPAVLEYSAAIARAASRLGVPCWDAGAALRAVPNGDAALFVDTVHPSAEGHRLYGTFLAEHVRRLMAGDPGGDCGTPEARPALAPAPPREAPPP